MNKWEPLFWEGTNYLLVPNLDRDKSSCVQCVFEDDSECPRYQGPGPQRRFTNCLVYERRTGKDAYLIEDTPEAIANYIANQLTS